MTMPDHRRTHRSKTPMNWPMKDPESEEKGDLGHAGIQKEDK